LILDQHNQAKINILMQEEIQISQKFWANYEDSHEYLQQHELMSEVSTWYFHLEKHDLLDQREKIEKSYFIGIESSMMDLWRLETMSKESHLLP
jgi:hypothetical protein